MPSLTNKKKLRIEIVLGDGTFGNNDQITLEGYRASINVSLAGGLQWGQTRGRIYGMSQSDMDTISTYAPRVGAFKPNIMRVYAIDGAQESLAFVGNIVTAWPDYQGAPSVFLDIQAQAGALNLLKAVPPRSFKGAIDVASAMKQIADSMSYGFENNGVTTVLNNQYLAGTGLDQARTLANIAQIQFWFDGQTIAIAPKGVPRGSVKPLISANTGMVGYPTYDGTTVVCRTLYNPAIQPGRQVQIQTDVRRANGDWAVLSMDHALDSETPNGAWFTTFRAINSSLYGKR